MCTVPVILFQIVDNFCFFNGYGGWYSGVRPYEPLVRDPWWIFCLGILFYVIAYSHGMSVRRIIRRSTRFGILFAAILLSLVFTVFDVVASITPFLGETLGINPWWKLSLVFKLLTDVILLNDFQTELNRLRLKRVKEDEKLRGGIALTWDDRDNLRYDHDEDAEHNVSSPTASRNYHVSVAGITHNGSTNDYRHDHIQAYESPWVRRKSKSMPDGSSEQIEFMQALDDVRPSDISGSSSGSLQQRHGRPQVGRGGMRATRLPSFFASVRPSKRQKQDPQAVSQSIMSNDAAPTVQCDSSRQLPQQETSGNALEQARMINEATIQELQARKHGPARDSTKKLRNTRHMILAHPGTQIYHSSLTDMTRTSPRDLQGSHLEVEEFNDEGEGREQIPTAGLGRTKSKVTREWWDQIEGDLDHLDNVDRIEDVEIGPAGG